MKCISLLALLLFPAVSLFSQNIEQNSQVFQKRNSISLEIGGYTAIGAVFYERVLVNTQKFKTVGQIGYGITGWPVSINGLISRKKHHFEFGGSIIFPSNLIIDSNASNSYLTGRLGYRYQKPEGKFIFRAGLMPVVLGANKEIGPELILWVWPGLSFGRVF
jgi:hypothetical protein